MAFKIERALTTLFGAYKLQSQGNLPVTLEERVNPVIDLGPHALAAAGLSTIGFGTGLCAVGVMGSVIQVEDWAVVGYGAYTIANNVSDWASLQVDLLPDGQNGSVFTICDFSRNTTVGSVTAFAIGEMQSSRTNHAFHSPLWTRKGTRWQLVCSAVSATVPTGFAELLYYPLSQTQ